MATAAQCEMYHVNLILHQSKNEKTSRTIFRSIEKTYSALSTSIGTPPRPLQAPSLNDHRLSMPSIVQNINNKWDSLSLPDGLDQSLLFEENHSIDSLTIDFQHRPWSTIRWTWTISFTRSPRTHSARIRSVRFVFTGNEAIVPMTLSSRLPKESTPSVVHPAMSRPYSASITQCLTVKLLDIESNDFLISSPKTKNTFEQIHLDESHLNQRFLSVSSKSKDSFNKPIEYCFRQVCRTTLTLWVQQWQQLPTNFKMKFARNVRRSITPHSWEPFLMSPMKKKRKSRNVR